jgi:hypothetical protein
MSTTTLEPQGAGTKVTVTTQLISLVGDDMINGVKVGQNASLDNLLKRCGDRQLYGRLPLHAREARLLPRWIYANQDVKAQ